MNILNVFCISDLHIEYDENKDLFNKLITKVEFSNKFNILCINGDVSHNFDKLIGLLLDLKTYFNLIFYVPGNHDVWINNEELINGLYKNSYDKYKYILNKCSEIGIYTYPTSITIENKNNQNFKILIAPIHSWNRVEFDCEDDVEIVNKLVPIEKMYSDFTRCKWDKNDLNYCTLKRTNFNAELTSYKELLSYFNIDYNKQKNPANYLLSDGSRYSLVSDLIDNLNFIEPTNTINDIVTMFTVGVCEYKIYICNYSNDMHKLFQNDYDINKLNSQFNFSITMSHFVPFPMLNPEKRFLFYPLLTSVIGSPILGQRLLRIKPKMHLFGHTHFGFNSTLKKLKHNEERDEKYNNISLDTIFIQIPFSYPFERKIRINSIEVGNCFEDFNDTIVFKLDSNLEYTTLTNSSYWSSYYEQNHRNPKNIKLASYVKAALETFGYELG